MTLYRMRGLLLPVAGLMLAASLAAQTVLSVEEDGKAYVVHRVHNHFYYVMKDGKLEPVRSSHLGLAPARQFAPVFISVANLRVHTSKLELINSGSEVNHEFHFEGEFKTAYTLANVFLVLELQTEKQGTVIFSQEIGDLTPGEARSVAVTVPVPDDIGRGRFQTHLFSDGVEVLHSLQPELFRENQLQKLVRARIAGVTQAQAKPFAGPMPVYPEPLLKAGVVGHAMVAIRITPTGLVLDPVVVSATDPAFGEAAVVAIRQWRFLPMVENGRAVESKVSLPFNFVPPVAATKS